MAVSTAAGSALRKAWSTDIDGQDPASLQSKREGLEEAASDLGWRSERMVLDCLTGCGEKPTWRR
jgi:hypothetical protein